MQLVLSSSHIQGKASELGHYLVKNQRKSPGGPNWNEVIALNSLGDERVCRAKPCLTGIDKERVEPRSWL